MTFLLVSRFFPFISSFEDEEESTSLRISHDTPPVKMKFFRTLLTIYSNLVKASMLIHWHNRLSLVMLKWMVAAKCNHITGTEGVSTFCCCYKLLQQHTNFLPQSE